MLKQIATDTWRVLSFRSPSTAMAEHWRAYLAFGLAATWIAGIGRYWDHPRALWWQHLGLGSVGYVFVLAFVLWALVVPMWPQRWSYRQALLFVVMTAPLGWLHAIPVERFLEPVPAGWANAGLLAVATAWRVALLAWFLRNTAGLRGLRVAVGTLLPLPVIMVALLLLDLGPQMFETMAGVGPGLQSYHELSFAAALTLFLCSMLAAPVVVVLYAVIVMAGRPGD